MLLFPFSHQVADSSCFVTDMVEAEERRLAAKKTAGKA
jgi:hypothetical protein